MAYVQRQGAMAGAWFWAGLLLLLVVPASEMAIIFVQRLVALLVRPQRLLRLEFKDELPPSARTMVIVPVLLTTVPEVEELLERIEVAAFANVDPHIHFAILSDFCDAPSREMPQDAALLEAARSGIESLNERFGSSSESRFFLFHRARQWNARDGIWMGWERKRGKIEEFNRLLRGSNETSFSVRIGSADVLPSVRYCLTLDSDTRLPRDAAKKLLGIIMHPLNQAQIDPVSRRVTKGYGILQPRVSVTMASAAGSLFARIYAGYTGVDPYTTAVSDLYQDLFGEGIFTGKGLYDVDAFMAALDNRVPENAVLSHDLFEGLYARTALVSDIEVVDDYPSSVLAHARRQHRWVRGDWQILLWLFPFVPTRTGLERNRLPLISRWKILDNLRRSLVAPATVALFMLGWTCLPGSPAVWTLGRAGGADVLAVALAPRDHRRSTALAALARAVRSTVIDDTKTALARAWLQLVFLAYQACQMTHAIAITIVRVAVTHRKMLEWQTAANSAQQHGQAARSGTRLFVEQMLGSPLFAAAALTTVALAAAARAAARPADPAVVDGGAPPRLQIQPAGHQTAPAGDQAGRSRVSATGGQQNVALFRRLCRRGGQRLGARQFSRDARAGRRAPHVTDQYRDGSARQPGGARPPIHPDQRACRTSRSDADDAREHGALRGPSVQLVRLAEPEAPRPTVYLLRGQRQSRGGAAHPGERPAGGDGQTGVRFRDVGTRRTDRSSFNSRSSRPTANTTATCLMPAVSENPFGRCVPILAGRAGGSQKLEDSVRPVDGARSRRRRVRRPAGRCA